MSPNTHFWLELTLTFGVPFTVGLIELRALRRGGPDGGGSWDGPREPPPAPLAPAPSEPKRLPACLIPVPLPADAVRARRERVPELV